MVGWHHCLNGHEFEQTPGDSKGQGSLVCYSPWGHKESDMTEQQKKEKKKKTGPCLHFPSTKSVGVSEVMTWHPPWAGCFVDNILLDMGFLEPRMSL